MKTNEKISLSLVLFIVVVGILPYGVYKAAAQPTQPHFNVGNPFWVSINFSEPMDTTVDPVIVLSNPSPPVMPGGGMWKSPIQFIQRYTVDGAVKIAKVDIEVSAAQDAAGNVMVTESKVDVFSIDTVPPVVLALWVGMAE